MLGWIIPEPLLMPPKVTVTVPVPSEEGSSIETAHSLFTVSVVMMALLASNAASRESESAGTRSRMPFFSLFISITGPITPVEPIRTSSFVIPRTSAAYAAVSSQTAMPSGPQPAFAMPVFTTTARTVPPSCTSFLSHSTGAAFTIFDVNVPAAVHGTSERIIAMSFRP